MFNQGSDGICVPVNWMDLPKNYNKIPTIHLNSIEKGILETKKPVKIKPKPTCINCGAQLHGFKCEYCGTEYEIENKNQTFRIDYKLSDIDDYTYEQGFLHREPLKPLPFPVYDMKVGTISASDLCAGFASIKNL